MRWAFDGLICESAIDMSMLLMISMGGGGGRGGGVGGGTPGNELWPSY